MGLFRWLSAHPLRAAVASIAIILLLGATSSVTAAPRTDRVWYPYLAPVADVTLTETGFGVSPVTDWSYEPDSVIEEAYRSASFPFEALRNVWFVLEPQPGSSLAAHTFLLFEFEGDRLLGLTIEARREFDEDYSALNGIFNAYELSYVWGSARDLMVRRAVMLDHDVFVYPVAITEAQRQTLLRRLLQRTEALETEPRYYNTLFSNCTNELAKAAGFSWAPAFILTGRSDEYLFRRGIIPGASFREAHRHSDVTEFVKGLNQAPADTFDAALLLELRRRFPG